MRDDELLEVTPTNVYLRKRILDSPARGREDKRAKEALEGGKSGCGKLRIPRTLSLAGGGQGWGQMQLKSCAS